MHSKKISIQPQHLFLQSLSIIIQALQAGSFHRARPVILTGSGSGSVHAAGGIAWNFSWTGFGTSPEIVISSAVGRSQILDDQ
jgi:hypothetical protein